MKWLVCFDISDDKKRTAVSSMLEEFGIRVQRSVFEIELSKKSLQKLLAKLQKEIDKTEDSVRFYPISVENIKKSITLGFGGAPFEGRDVYFF